MIVPHITVCICTYKRTRYLALLLDALALQETSGAFTYSIQVVDNDQARSAEPVVNAFKKVSPVQVAYSVEPRQNIALARNTALSNAHGDFIAFIDDDEVPIRQWLSILFTECEKRQVAGVLGPVMPRYEETPPEWVLVGGFYDRASYPTGLVIDGTKGRTGNVLFRTSILHGETLPFRPEFRTGEDQDFFHRMIAKGHVFTWCHEAMAHEWVPPIRWNRRFLLRRALLRGVSCALYSTLRVRDIVKSLIAVPAYLVALPFAALFSHGRFMRYMVSLFDHLGKLLGVVGINPVKEQYVTGTNRGATVAAAGETFSRGTRTGTP